MDGCDVECTVCKETREMRGERESHVDRPAQPRDGEKNQRTLN